MEKIQQNSFKGSIITTLLTLLLIGQFQCWTPYYEISYSLIKDTNYSNIEINQDGSILGISVNQSNIEIHKLNKVENRVDFLQQLNPNGYLSGAHSFIFSKNASSLFYMDRLKARIYMYNMDIDGRYSTIPTVNLSTNACPNHASLNDDLLCVIFYSQNKTSLYKITANSIDFLQDLIIPNTIKAKPTSCTISNDHNLVAVGYLHSSDDQRFQYDYALKVQGNLTTEIRISDDMQTLILGGYYPAYAFLMNCSTNKFSPLETVYSECKSVQVESIINGLYAYVGCANQNQSKVIILQRQQNLKYKQIQTLTFVNKSKLYIAVSKDGQYLGVGFWQSEIAKIFKLNCLNAPPTICSQCYYPCQTCSKYDKTKCLTYRSNYVVNQNHKCKGCPSYCKQCKIQALKIICSYCSGNQKLNFLTNQCIYQYYQLSNSQMIIGIIAMLILCIWFLLVLRKLTGNQKIKSFEITASLTEIKNKQ